MLTGEMEDIGGDTGDPGTGVDVQGNWSNEVFERLRHDMKLLNSIALSTISGGTAVSVYPSMAAVAVYPSIAAVSVDPSIAAVSVDPSIAASISRHSCICVQQKSKYATHYI